MFFPNALSSTMPSIVLQVRPQANRLTEELYMLASHFHEETVRDAQITYFSCIVFTVPGLTSCTRSVESIHGLNRMVLKTTSWCCRVPLATLVRFPAGDFACTADSKSVVRVLF